MSCPKCGSGAVFQGKCRECGTIVDRRASSAAVARAPSLADEDLAEDTIADPRGRRRDPEATMAPPGRRPGPALMSIDEEDDPERTRMPSPPRKSPPPEAESSPPPPPSSRSARASQQAPPVRPKPPEPPEPLKPMEVQDRSSWYKEAGLAPPAKRVPGASEELGSGESSVSITAPSPIGGHTSPAAVLFAQAATAMLGIVFGLSPIGLVAGGVALIAGILLVKGVGAGKFVAWLAVGVFIAYAGALALSSKQPILAVLTLVPTGCLVGALLAEARSVRSALGGVGVAVALLGLVVPAVASRKAGGGDQAAEADTSAFEEAATGISTRMPASVNLYSRRKDIEKRLPEPWRSMGLKLGFATADDSFVGGMLQTTQPPGAELRNLLAPLSEGLVSPPRKNDRLIPDGLAELESEGWELSTRAGELLVVVTRAPDGRAFTLFGVTGTAKARNTQLFKAVADGFQVKKYLRVAE